MSFAPLYGFASLYIVAVPPRSPWTDTPAYRFGYSKLTFVALHRGLLSPASNINVLFQLGALGNQVNVMDGGQQCLSGPPTSGCVW